MTVDFKKCPVSRSGYNIVAIFIDRLSKRLIIVPIKDTIIAKELVPLFLLYILRYVGLPDSITLDYGLQFVSNFWDKVYQHLGIKIRLSTANYPQIDSQTEIINQYFDQRLWLYVNYYQTNQDEWIAIIDYQQACLQHETTGQSPFLTEKGYEPRISFDWESLVSARTLKEQLNRTEAKALIGRLHQSQEHTKASIAQSQDRYTRQANKHRREVDFRVKDKVQVSTKYWKTDRPSRKLAQQIEGPFEIIKQVGHSFKLRLLESIKVHPVFYANRLRKAPENPRLGQSNPDLLPVQVNDQEEYEVQYIVAVKPVRGTLKYRAKQKGQDDDPNQYLALSFSNSPLALEQFYATNPDQPGPPRNLQYQLDYAKNDLFPDTNEDDNKPTN